MILYLHQSHHKQEIRLILWRPFCFSILNPLPAKFRLADSRNEFGIPKSLLTQFAYTTLIQALFKIFAPDYFYILTQSCRHKLPRKCRKTNNDCLIHIYFSTKVKPNYIILPSISVQSNQIQWMKNQIEY